MKLLSKKSKPRGDSIWNKELIPPDSVWRKNLVPTDSIWGRDLLAFSRRKPQCLECPILIAEDQHMCNKYNRIPVDIWDGLETCPLYEEHEERKLG
jgi:hypothetical protein